MNSMEKCELCPRKCGVDRTKKCGFCGETDEIRIANFQLHFWEEPVISGKNGSGTVFFSGCVLKCVFCQNYEISALNKGYVVSEKRLSEIFLELQEKGANNINLVNPTHFVPQIIRALDLVRGKLQIPVVYNCGGYENTETLEMLRGYVDVFLPDLKYFDSAISKEYSMAENYFEKAINAIGKMVEITGKPVVEKGLIKRGTVVRHLVLPNHRKDSIEVVKRLGERFGKDEIFLSLMSQYTPMYKAKDIKKLNRRTSTFEYKSVVDVAVEYGWDGFVQERSSADECFVPPFSDKPCESDL